ncbi:response regulator [bacterium]|nr:response regulator [bacterium]
MADLDRINVLIVDDDELIRIYLRAFCQVNGWGCVEAGDGLTAIEILRSNPDAFCLALLDLHLPGLTGLEVLPELLKLGQDLAVIVMTGYAEIGIAVEALQKGAVDLIEKPLDNNLLLSRIEKALELRKMRRANQAYFTEMEQQVRLRTSNSEAALKATIFGLARLAEQRDNDSGFHLERMAHYTLTLAKSLRERNLYRNTLDDDYLENLFDSAPLHDIGKAGVPESILLKPGPLDENECKVMHSHTSIGERTLADIQSRVETEDFLLLGIELTRSHHERFDGSGYPEGLIGNAIPLSARLVALADFFDAVTTVRIYRTTTFTGNQAASMIAGARGTHFDPDIVDAFLASRHEFTRIHQDFMD